MFSLKELICKYSPRVLILVETKISSAITDGICRKIGFNGIFQVKANGFTSGIWLLWPKKEIQL